MSKLDTARLRQIANLPMGGTREEQREVMQALPALLDRIEELDSGSRQLRQCSGHSWTPRERHDGSPVDVCTACRYEMDSGQEILDMMHDDNGAG